MKLAKMSLAAAVLLGASAFAIDNVKVSGDAKVYYSTSDQGATIDLFDKDGSAADTALRVGVTGDLLKGVSFGATAYAVSTLGLENNLVSGVWSGAHDLTPNPTSSFGFDVDDAAWMGELWMAATMGKTTAKVGRMELDTPLAFSEKWSVVPNTFEGAIALNQDLPDTTLVGGYVGKGNGGALVVDTNGAFSSFISDGAYVAAVINNSYKPLTAQAWYYNISNIADAYWLQADIDCQLVKGVKIGAQFAEISPKNVGLAFATQDTEAYAVKLGYEGIQNLKVSVAYSDVDKADALNAANVATGTGQSKLYTEAQWVDSYGYVSAPDTESWNVKASYEMKDVARFCASYTNADNGAAANVGDMEEIALSASKSFGALDTKVSYINTELNGGNDYNTVNVYLTLNF